MSEVWIHAGSMATGNPMFAMRGAVPVDQASPA